MSLVRPEGRFNIRCVETGEVVTGPADALISWLARTYMGGNYNLPKCTLVIEPTESHTTGFR